MSTGMNKVRGFLFVIVSSLCFILTGCGKTDLSSGTSEVDSKADGLIQNTENEAKNDLDNWIGRYTFEEAYSEEGYASMFMDYDINIYKENDQYYADVVVNGQMTGIDLKARLYGDDEWISLVIEEYNPEHVMGLSEMENTVLLSLERQGDDIYTYWGVLYPLAEDSPSSGIYFEKATEEEAVQLGTSKERSGLEDWIGEYAFSEEMKDYDITIYEEGGQYNADLRISGGDIGIDVKAELYGNDEWISLVLAGYDPEPESGLENMKNGVLLSLRKQGDDIYTYWGGQNVTEWLNDNGYDCFEYYDSLHFFEKIGEKQLDIPENLLAFYLVLNSKKPFTSAEEGCQEFYWDEYYWHQGELEPSYTTTGFMLVDMDSDGEEELVLTGYMPETTQILDYQDGKVYSYQFAYRGVKGILPNGIFNGSSAYDIGGFYRLRFDKGTYEEETLAYMEHDYFEVEGKEVSSEEFDQYTEDFINTEEQVEEIDFTEEMLEKNLLGDLTEEERSVVENIAQEEIIEKANYTTEELQGYLDVLVNGKEFICVTDEGKHYFLADDYIRSKEGDEEYQIYYFSVVDMDGDGQAEVVLTCYPDTVLILHAEQEEVRGYQFSIYDEMRAIADDGTYSFIKNATISYGKIISFGESGYETETNHNPDNDISNRVRYYFFSEEMFDTDNMGVNEDKRVIKVDGWDMEYTISERKLVVEDFADIEIGSSLDEIENKLGKPDGWVGGGILLPVYVLEDNSAVELVFKNDETNEDLEAIYLYKEQKEIVLKK